MPDARPYRRVLALITLDGTDERIARKAMLLARLNHAELMFLHLVEADAALDGYPAASARAAADAHAAAAKRRLDFLAAQLGAAEAECVALHGPARQRFKQLVDSWQPDLVISARPLECADATQDILILGRNHPSRRGRLIGRALNWLSTQLLPA